MVLELRMLAHYMNDEGFIDEILNGDIHTANQRLAGLESRNQAKTFIYALIYGAGDEKIGTVVGGSKKDGKRLRELSSIICHHLELLSLKYRELQPEVSSKE